MPLNLSVNDGEFTPYIKYNAKAGRFYVRPEGAQDEVEIDRPRLAFDMRNIKTGWIYYPEGAGPEKVWDPSPSVAAPKPPGPRKFKRGFEVTVFGPDVVPRVGRIGLREFSSTASNVIGAIIAMHKAYEDGLAAHPGQAPVYTCTSVKPVNGAYGTNYEPIFELTSWVPREKIEGFVDLPPERAPAALSEQNPPDPLDDEIPF